jgi:hypothetical protein
LSTLPCQVTSPWTRAIVVTIASGSMPTICTRSTRERLTRCFHCGQHNRRSGRADLLGSVDQPLKLPQSRGGIAEEVDSVVPNVGEPLKLWYTTRSNSFSVGEPPLSSHACQMLVEATMAELRLRWLCASCALAGSHKAVAQAECSISGWQGTSSTRSNTPSATIATEASWLRWRPIWTVRTTETALCCGSEYASSSRTPNMSLCVPH